jgi:hypothetical protein
MERRGAPLGPKACFRRRTKAPDYTSPARREDGRGGHRRRLGPDCLPSRDFATVRRAGGSTTFFGRRPPTLRCLAGFGVALFLPFGRTETPLRPANARITRSVDRANVYGLDLAFRRLAAHLRNTPQIGRFSSVNRRVAGSNPARGANYRKINGLSEWADRLSIRLRSRCIQGSIPHRPNHLRSIGSKSPCRCEQFW